MAKASTGSTAGRTSAAKGAASSSGEVRSDLGTAGKGSSAGKGSLASGAMKGSDTATQDAEALLKADHRTVEQLFEKYAGLEDGEEKTSCVQEICRELIVHAMLEEEIFYPACREKHVESSLLDEAQVEHDGAKLLIRELLEGSPEDEFYDAKVTVLREYIKHHVGEEEKRSDGIFAQARKAGVDMAALGQQVQARKQQLMAEMEGEELSAPQPKSLQSMTNPRSQEVFMARYDDDRERDRQGRFSGGNGGGSSRGGRSSSSGRERDEYGRFMSEDDDRGYRGGSSRGGGSRYDDDDDRGYRGRSSSSGGGSRRDDDDDGRGWYGDPEGHSEASRLGWEHRRGGGSGGRYEDDRGGSRGGRYEDERGGSRGGGYSSRSGGGGGYRSRDDDDDRGYRGSYSSRGGSRSDDDDGRGWYGDPEGHSEASRLGWEHRRGSSGGSSGRGQGARGGGGSSRSRYDDDDDGRGHGRGGWFGDPEGHSEASRRGWRNRD